ncbi:non-ribosomal peptide synthetase [Actinoplanes friuliensis]|uniref:Non-ribosomal peptide synthetase n=2 Tax=Actinoplanes friuliensis TaxID=196914 RepID=U5W217_9ACTN|nr:amino acid adenylation domain-containing protein [Actinoplanes friuliensis]AGZ41976.1 non-ribosomal peptide synthetase [Actinoplanes friuliensis DSM 7358]CAD32904.2 non-ribosomal peptide synthetase A [Actinoplanes friuliensis]
MTSAAELTGTAAPRWTGAGNTATGPGLQRVRLPDDLVRALRSSGADLASVLLAVHARVLATVTAEHEVQFGLVAPGSAAQSGRRLEVTKSTWRELTAQARAAVAIAGDCEVVLDLSALDGDPAAPAGGEPLRLSYAGGDDLHLTVRHDRAVLDDTYAQRLAGYHLTALRAYAEDPDAPHHRRSLLSDAEMETQLYHLAGRRAELPRTTFPEVFEEQVQAGPNRVAASHGTATLTYEELNARANRIAHALLGAGLTAEAPVAVVLDRTLDWLAAAIGVFKAGGVYLPVRPDFPADRIAAQLARSECRLVLAEPGSEDLAHRAVAVAGADAQVLSVPEVLAGDAATTDPGVPVAPEQAAYIYFTSGSTGTPKGALCEHAGMLNHLLMKLEDMGMTGREGEVVTQTASQCFDISLWQFAAPLMAGGSVRIVDTDVLLSVGGFLDELVGNNVTVAQIVPSYLEVVLTHLEQWPRPLGRLRSLSVTGEALKLELVQRWFAAYPDIALVNAYGATEVSDDTMHEILDGLPDRDFVTVGTSRRNINTYIVDENLALVPLGSPGEIAFSGVCVGRGYINDEERTRQAFVADPYRSGTRMYRTGDFGRWLPEGRIEFLGRRDEQVKIRGFRIEIGEIENKLLTFPGVRESAVVIDDGAGEMRNLVAFYSGDGVEPEHLRDFLAGLLPEYMVPTYFHGLQQLPLTENLKVDKKVLKRLAGTLGHGGATYVAPTTPTEQRLATLWAEVLGVPLERLGRDDDFFELGGTSLAAVRMLISMNGTLSLKQLVGNPRLGELATVLDGRETAQTRSGLVQPLSTVTNPHHALVCFPYAGGNAVNFRALATALRHDGIAVYGVELPGHDLAADREPMADVPQIAARVAAEIRDQLRIPVLLWGHCAGAAAALATARLLEQAGAPAERVFLGALLVESAGELRRESAEAEAADNPTLLARLRAESAYVELDGLQPERLDIVGSSYRHDVVTANRYLLDLLAEPHRHRIEAPVHVVAAADDPTTPGHETRYADWKLVADRVELHEVADGGHYFAGSRPEATAELVRAACAVRQPAPVGGAA